MQSRLFRVYFNRSSDPQKWSVDEGDASTEVTVMGVEILQLSMVTRWLADKDVQPCAWVEVWAERCTIRGGIAVLS